MSFFEWTDSLKIGVPLVDHDHRFLVSLINQLHDAVGEEEERDVLETVLDALVEYTVYHFGREERVMEACGYPGLAQHRKRHEALASQVFEVHQRFRDDRSAIIGQDVLEFLKTWLLDHVQKQDQQIAPHARDNAAAIRAAQQVPRLAVNVPGGGMPKVNWQDVSVLIVEGNASFRKVLNTILQTVDVKEIIEAENGAQALQAVSKSVPDVILSDWYVDDMDVLELRNAVGDSIADGVDSVPFVVMLGHDSHEFEKMARDAGVSEFLEKPVTAKGMLMAVARAIEEKE